MKRLRRFPKLTILAAFSSVCFAAGSVSQDLKPCAARAVAAAKLALLAAMNDGT